MAAAEAQKTVRGTNEGGATGPANKPPRLCIQGASVLLDGVPVALGMTEELRKAAVCYLTHLLAAGGDWRSSTELDDMEGNGACKDHIGIRWDRVRKQLPDALYKLTETDRRKGNRLISSVWHK